MYSWVSIISIDSIKRIGWSILWISLLNVLYDLKIGPRKLNVQDSIKRIGSARTSPQKDVIRMRIFEKASFSFLQCQNSYIPAMLNIAESAEQRLECWGMMRSHKQFLAMCYNYHYFTQLLWKKLRPSANLVLLDFLILWMKM